LDAGDIEGDDVRAAAVGLLTAVYWINRSAGRLYLVSVVWLGSPAIRSSSNRSTEQQGIGSLCCGLRECLINSGSADHGDAK
jgi:hypothetical protein